MDYSNDYLLTSNDAAAAAVGMVVIVILLLCLGVSVISYVLNSVGLYTIAKRRGITNPWLSWIPVAHFWIVGSISDQFRYVTKGQIKNKRKILVIGGVAAWILGTVLSVAADFAGEAGLLMILAPVAAMAASITMVVTYYMAMYDLYTSVNPAYNVVFLVLSIIFNFTEPFFVFFNRKKDLGMPRVGGSAPVSIPEPWVNNPEA